MRDVAMQGDLCRPIYARNNSKPIHLRRLSLEGFKNQYVEENYSQRANRFITASRASHKNCINNGSIATNWV